MRLKDLASPVDRSAHKRSWIYRLLSPGVSVVHVDVKIAGLPVSMDGFSLVHVSDLHLREDLWEPERLAEAASLIRGERPSLVLNSGDFLQDDPPADLVVRSLKEIVLPDTETFYRPANIAVLGNHDFTTGLARVNELVKDLRELGVAVPLNRAVSVMGPGGEVCVVGLTMALPRFDRALEMLRSAEHPRIALIHEPEVAERIPPGSADLILAGHTHGAQVSIPGLRRWAVKHFAKSNYVAGLYRVNGMPLYINRGLGTTGPPIRFGASPEVTVVRLIR